MGFVAHLHPKTAAGHSCIALLLLSTVKNGGITAVPLIKGDKLRPLAVTTEKRLASLPDVPTFSEAGVNNVAVWTWYGVWAPNGTPENIVERLNQVFRMAASKEEVLAVLSAQGTEAHPMDVAEFSQFVSSEHQRWTKVVKDARIAPE